jgi:hypothetical protein
VADICFNISKGRIAEKAADGASNFIVMLLSATSADAALADFDTVALMLAGTPDEATFTNYARKTGLTGVITVDDTNDRVDVDLPDQTWTAAGGAANNTLVKLVVAYEESAADSGRIPLTAHDFAVTTDGSDLTAQFNAAGFIRIT